MFNNPNPCFLLQQNLVDQPTKKEKIALVRDMLLRRLITLPNWPIIRLDAQYVTNLFFTATGFNHLKIYELDECRKDPSTVYTSRKPLFVLHPRFRRPFTSNRTVLLEILPLLKNWPSKNDRKRYIAFTNLFLTACRFSRLKPAEELGLLYNEEANPKPEKPLRTSTPIPERPLRISPHLDLIESIPFDDMNLDEVDSPPIAPKNSVLCKLNLFKK